MDKEKIESITEIKTIEEFLVEKGVFITTDTDKMFNLNITRDGYVKTSKDIVNAVREYINQMIDFIADNIETDYTYHGHKAGEIDLANNLEVYCVKGQFDKIKKLIK